MLKIKPTQLNSNSTGVLQVHAIMLNSFLEILECVGMLEKEHCPFQNVCNTIAVGYGAGDQNDVARVATDESSGPSSLGSSGGAVGGRLACRHVHHGSVYICDLCFCL